MNRRKAIGGILGLTGIGFVSVYGAKYFIGNSKKKGSLKVHKDLLAELVEVIIPTATSPGAKESLVHEYIISYVEDCASRKEYNNFINGLNDLQETSFNSFNSIFEECSETQKKQLLENLEESTSYSGILLKINNKLRGRSFFNILKTLTIEGYCTSQIGATKHLQYMAIPGKFKHISQMDMNQKAWATK